MYVRYNLGYSQLSPVPTFCIAAKLVLDDRAHEICQSCQKWPAKFRQILLMTDTKKLFCNRILMRTDNFFHYDHQTHMQFPAAGDSE